jgi:hypothetical protein
VNPYLDYALVQARRAEFAGGRRMRPRTVISNRPLVLVVLLAALTIGGLVHAPHADAAQRWYWTESKAETRWKQRYRVVRTASCIGIDAQAKFINGRWYDRGFFCSGELWDGREYQITLHVRGKRRFIWFRY